MGKLSYNFPSLPSFYEDPMFKTTQSDLYGFGSKLLAGDPGEYYGLIGSVGGPEFEEVLRRSNRDIEKGALEVAAKTGAPGGAVLSAVSKAVGDNTANLRWQDVLKAAEGRKYLMGEGLNTLGLVDSNALSFGDQKNQFNLGVAELETNRAIKEAELAAQQKAAKSQMWSNILSAGIGAAGNIFGMRMLSNALGSASGAAGAASGSVGDLSSMLDFNSRLAIKY